MTQPEPVILGAVRTPHGRENGAFVDIRSEDLSIPLINEILAQTGLTGDQVDDLMWGCAKQHGEQGTTSRALSRFSPISGNQSLRRQSIGWMAPRRSRSSARATRFVPDNER